MFEQAQIKGHERFKNLQLTRIKKKIRLSYNISLVLLKLKKF